MAEPEDTRRDIGWIRYLWRTAKRPVDAITAWAKKPNYREKIHRFRSAQKWATNMQEAAKTSAARLKFKALRYRWKAKADWLEAHPPEPAPVGNMTTLDGREVPTWIANILKEARAAGVWKGYVISGYRSPEYSEQLCYGICGAPSCSGTCAGRSSNHCCPPSYKGVPYEGAVDCTDAYNLRRFCESHGKPLIGGGAVLSRDVPHFSHSGR